MGSRTETKTGGRAATQARIAGRFAVSVGDAGMPAPDGWSWVLLSDIARMESGHTPSRKRSDYWGGDVPWLSVTEATRNHGRVLTDASEHITQAGLENSSARLLPAHTVCLSRTASIGFVVAMGCPMATSQGFVNWVCTDEVNWRYLMYLLMAEQASMLKFAGGSAHQTIYYPELKALRVCLPPREEQDAIVSVLAALDEKDESNRRTQVLLGRASAAIFDAATEDAKWSRHLGELVQVIDCLHSRKPEHHTDGKLMLQLHNIRDDGLLDLSEQFLISDEDYANWTRRIELSEGDCVITNVGRVGAVARIPECTAALGRNMTGLRVRSEWPHPALLVEALLSRRMRSEMAALTDAGTVMDALNVRNIPKLPLPALPSKQAAELDAALGVIWEYREHLVRESALLRRLHSVLLPALISGQERIPSVRLAAAG